VKSDIRIIEIEPSFRAEPLRTPLKFGTGVVREITSFTARAKVESGTGQVAEGYGQILLSDVWAFPSLKLSHDERDRALREMSIRYCKVVSGFPHPAHPIDIHFETKEELLALRKEVQKALGLSEEIPVLAALLSASPVDAALHDAFGHANGISSYEGYAPPFLRWDLSRFLGSEFRGEHISNYLRDSFLPELPIFHLVGGMDKLRCSEVTGEDPKDGLPVALEEWIERDGVFCFKVKLKGNDIEWDVERTKAVAEVARESLMKLGKRKFYFSVDSNEMCESPEYVKEYYIKLREASKEAFDALLYYEQPTERELERHGFDMREVGRIKPVIADEGVTDLEKLDLAISLGWSGVALKTCKGHSSALLYIAKVAKKGLFYTVQDLTNPGRSFVHSAGLAARSFPMMGVEYNSRQYLPHSDEDIQRKHRDLFVVRGGKIRTDSIGKIGLGY